MVLHIFAVNLGSTLSLPLPPLVAFSRGRWNKPDYFQRGNIRRVTPIDDLRYLYLLYLLCARYLLGTGYDCVRNLNNAVHCALNYIFQKLHVVGLKIGTKKSCYRLSYAPPKCRRTLPLQVGHHEPQRTNEHKRLGAIVDAQWNDPVQFRTTVAAERSPAITVGRLASKK